jgi:hypothetical protein
VQSVAHVSSIAMAVPSTAPYLKPEGVEGKYRSGTSPAWVFRSPSALTHIQAKSLKSAG